MTIAYRRAATALTLAGTAAAVLYALAGPAAASGGSLSNITITPGNEACIAAAATSSVGVAGTAASPGLKFKLIAQSGYVVSSSSGPVTTFSAFTYAGAPDWQGAGDYTACAKNNGTAGVLLRNLTITTS